MEIVTCIISIGNALAVNAIVEWDGLTENIGCVPVYGAYFDRQIFEPQYGAYHGCDVKYAFGSLEDSWRPYSNIDKRITQNVIDYFTAYKLNGTVRPDSPVYLFFYRVYLI